MPHESHDPETIQQLASIAATAINKINVDPETVEQDLARLVLGLMEFLRQLMELQAIRKMENGHLSPEQEETLGSTLMKAEEAILHMAEKFGLAAADLSLDLGPLGKTI